MPRCARLLAGGRQCSHGAALCGLCTQHFRQEYGIVDRRPRQQYLDSDDESRGGL